MNPNQTLTRPASNAVANREDKAMEFVPFGAQDKIKLTVEIVKRIVAVPTKSGQTCTDRDAIRFMMLCQAQRLNPFAGDAFLTGYDGKNGAQFSLITSHVAFLKRAESCVDFEGMESGIILCDPETGLINEREGDFKMPQETCVGGWAKVYRKGRKPTYRRLSIAAMKPSYETPFWSADKAPGMIVKCAEADALRATFPSLLGGLNMQGEERVIVDTTPAADYRLPANQRLVADAPEAADGADDVPMGDSPQQPDSAPTAPPAGERDTVLELEACITEAGFTFAEFLAWGKATKNFTKPGAKGWSDVEPGVALRILRRKEDMISQIAKGV